MGLLSSKKTTNITENKTDVDNFDNRVGASDDAIALGSGAVLDQSFTDKSDNSFRLQAEDNSDHSITDNSDRRITDKSDNSFRLNATDNSDNRTFNHIEQLSDDVAREALSTARGLGDGAFALVSDGLAAQNAAQRENRLLAEHATAAIADTTRSNLESTLNLLGSNSDGVLNLAREIAASGQQESAAARAGANDTIKEVLGFKESSDTKIAQDLIKWGGVILGLLALVFLARPRRAS